MNRNMLTVLLGVSVVLSFMVQPVFSAGEMLKKLEGSIQIKRPDGTVIKVGEKDKVPTIPSGSIVEVLDGKIDVKPVEGEITVLLGSTSVKVGDKGRVIASYNSKTGLADFKYGGEVSITKGNTTVNIQKGQRAQILLNKKTGEVTVKSIKGKIETITNGVKVMVPQDGIAKLIVDEKTKNVSIESEAGDLEIISSKGTVTIVSEGTTVVADRVGELVKQAKEKTEPIKKETPKKQEQEEETIYVEPIIQDEPAEPEYPEGSPYQP